GGYSDNSDFTLSYLDPEYRPPQPSYAAAASSSEPPKGKGKGNAKGKNPTTPAEVAASSAAASKSKRPSPLPVAQRHFFAPPLPPGRQRTSPLPTRPQPGRPRHTPPAKELHAPQPGGHPPCTVPFNLECCGCQDLHGQVPGAWPNQKSGETYHIGGSCCRSS